MSSGLSLLGVSLRFTTKLPNRCEHPRSVIRKSCMPKVPKPAAYAMWRWDHGDAQPTLGYLFFLNIGVTSGETARMPLLIRYVMISRTNVWLNISPRSLVCAHLSESHAVLLEFSSFVFFVIGRIKETTDNSVAGGHAMPLFLACHSMISFGVK